MFKKIAATVAATLLLSIGAASAKADPVQLSYLDFQATPGYQLLQAEATANNNALAQQHKVRFSTTLTATVAGVAAASVSQVAKTDGSASQVTTTMTTSGSVTGPFDVYLNADGVYLPQTLAVGLTGAINLDAAVKRLGYTNSDIIHAPLSAYPSNTQFQPNALYSGEPADALAQLGDPTFNLGGSSLSSYTYTEPVASPNADDPTLTDYSYTVTMPANGGLAAMPWNIVATYTQAHLLTKSSLSLDLGLIQESIVTTETIDNSISVTMPTARSISYTALLSLGRKIQAENSLAAKATKVALKAGKTVTQAKLIAAAKALKYAYGSVKNGIKLSAKYLGVTGSVCVTAVKGKAVKAHC